MYFAAKAEGIQYKNKNKDVFKCEFDSKLYFLSILKFNIDVIVNIKPIPTRSAYIPIIGGRKYILEKSNSEPIM